MPISPPYLPNCGVIGRIICLQCAIYPRIISDNRGMEWHYHIMLDVAFSSHIMRMWEETCSYAWPYMQETALITLLPTNYPSNAAMRGISHMKACKSKSWHPSRCGFRLHTSSRLWSPRKDPWTSVLNLCPIALESVYMKTIYNNV